MGVVNSNVFMLKLFTIHSVSKKQSQVKKQLPRAELASGKADMAGWQVNSIGDTIRCLSILYLS